jgi:hypothetical protein
LIGSLRLFVVQQQIGERATNIDAKSHFAIPSAVPHKIASYSVRSWY